MSWCGGGGITPSPGLAAWAILIWIWSADDRYSAVTPKRPEATCLMRLRSESPSCRGRSTSTFSAPITLLSVSPFLIGMPLSSLRQRAASSPPSPVLLLPPMRFMATASVAWASVEMEPNDMAPVAKRLTISLAGSDSLNERNRLGGVDLELEQAAQRHVALALVVDQLGVFLVGVPVVGARAVLQLGNRIGRPHVVFAPSAPGVFAAGVQHGL